MDVNFNNDAVINDVKMTFLKHKGVCVRRLDIFHNNNIFNYL